MIPLANKFLLMPLENWSVSALNKYFWICSQARWVCMSCEADGFVKRQIGDLLNNLSFAHRRDGFVFPVGLWLWIEVLIGPVVEKRQIASPSLHWSASKSTRFRRFPYWELRCPLSSFSFLFCSLGLSLRREKKKKKKGKDF